MTNDYRIAREIIGVDDDVRAAGPPPVPTAAGEFALRPVDPDADAAMLQEWFAREHLASTWEQEWSSERWSADARYRLSGDYSRPVIFARNGVDVGYLEIYRV
ncbi:MAG: GNAT family N-acetyltransferase, partial [Gordonia sp. (in: high G+C Gram-positive bacteria)]